MKMTTEKMIVAVSMGVSGWSLLASSFSQIPPIPAVLTTPFLWSISVTTLAAIGTLYGIYMLYNKF